MAKKTYDWPRRLMGMRAWLAWIVVLSTGLAGCAGSGDGLSDAERAARDLQIQATATTGVVRGVVVDQALRPLAGATVVLAGGAETTSNEAGAFGFDDLEPGTYFLTASLDYHTTVQQSADVVAGVSDPSIVRILLTAIPRLTPFVEAFQAKMYVIGAISTPVVLLRLGDELGEEGDYSFRLDITPNGTVAQAEFAWESQSPLSETLLIGGGTYLDGERVDTSEAVGASPLVLLANATDADETSDNVRYNMWAGDFDDPPAVYLQQKVDAFVHVFHNFRPEPGWMFTSDGAHPLPP